MASIVKFTSNWQQFSPNQLIEFYRASSDQEITDKKAQELLNLIHHADFILIATINSMIIGVIRTISDGVHSNFIDDIRVHPNYRRLGLGTELLRLMQHELPNVELHHLITNGRLDQKIFYESQGFTNTQVDGSFILNNFHKEIHL